MPWIILSAIYLVLDIANIIRAFVILDIVQIVGGLIGWLLSAYFLLVVWNFRNQVGIILILIIIIIIIVFLVLVIGIVVFVVLLSYLKHTYNHLNFYLFLQISNTTGVVHYQMNYA